jgi:hypothetical protein
MGHISKEVEGTDERRRIGPKAQINKRREKKKVHN